jgi:hypothetical protein
MPMNNHVGQCHWKFPAQQPFCFSLGTLVMNVAMIHLIMNDAQEVLLSFNGFCFSTRRKLFMTIGASYAF